MYGVYTIYSRSRAFLPSDCGNFYIIYEILTLWKLLKLTMKLNEMVGNTKTRQFWSNILNVNIVSVEFLFLSPR